MKKIIGKKVIVRCDRSGVFFGTLSAKDGMDVELSNARKLFYWSGAAAVEQIAVDGVANPNTCKFTITVDNIYLTDAIQIIPCTDKAVKNIQSVRVWKI
jgi:small nuclear ribonucleoprotein (snRNP)-like protein